MPRPKRQIHPDQFSLFPPYSQAQIRHAILTANPYIAADMRRFAAVEAVLSNAERLLTLKYRRAIKVEELLRQHLDELSDWRALFSARGKSHYTLNITLDAIARSANLPLLVYLPYLELQRPITDPAQLRFVLIACAASADAWIWSHEPKGIHVSGVAERTLREDNVLRNYDRLKLYENADLKDIESAMSLYAEFTGQSNEGFILEPESALEAASGVYGFVKFLNDDPEPPRGDIQDLVWHAVDFHRDYLGVQPAMRATRLRPEIKHAQSLQHLPVANFSLPDCKMQQLITVKQLFDEAKNMRHCVDTYVKKVLAGRSYLFHFEYEGCKATLECNPEGYLIQAKGPRNHANAATDYATELFRKQKP